MAILFFLSELNADETMLVHCYGYGFIIRESAF